MVNYQCCFYALNSLLWWRIRKCQSNFGQKDEPLFSCQVDLHMVATKTQKHKKAQKTISIKVPLSVRDQ